MGARGRSAFVAAVATCVIGGAALAPLAPALSQVKAPPAPLMAPASASAPARVPSAGDAGAVQRVVDALRAITTLRADFTQADRNGAVVSGELTFKNPGRIRFEYGDDVNLLVVSDGRSLSLVDYDVNQVERWPISSSPLGALLDPKRDVGRYGRLLPTTSPNVVSIEVSDPAKPEFGLITLIFVASDTAPGGLELASWVALDAQNNRTTVRLRNHRYGIAVPDSAFRFRDPRPASRRAG